MVGEVACCEREHELAVEEELAVAVVLVLAVEIAVPREISFKFIIRYVDET